MKYRYRPSNRIQTMDNGGIIFPRDVLCPISWIGMPDVYTQNTITIHKYDDLLIDNCGKEYAAAQRREIEEIIKRAECD